jgi:hypothetical protein
MLEYAFWRSSAGVTPHLLNANLLAEIAIRVERKKCRRNQGRMKMWHQPSLIVSDA